MKTASKKRKDVFLVYSYDDLEKPSVIAQGTLRLPGSPVPSMLIFASWERFNKYLWDFSIKSGRSFRRSVIGPLDSALAMYWPIGKLKPNENYTIKTYYGLMAKEAIPTSKVIQITLGGPSVTTGEAVKVTANIKNTSKYEIKNVKAEMILPPDGLKLNFNENSFKNLATLKKEESKDTGWSIIPSKTKTGSMTIRVKVTGTIKDKEVIEIAEKVIEYKEVTYTLYDFSYINRLINRVNQNKENNNNKLNDVNRAISEKLDAVYSQENRNTDREAIDERIKDSQKIKEEIPKAVNSAIKNEKK
ncbi:MAG: hypothetical protein KKH98_07165 [Spirochaetes bacterium]|nr:hypothetical protein [Spirochaetota bacterium]